MNQNLFVLVINPFLTLTLNHTQHVVLELWFHPLSLKSSFGLSRSPGAVVFELLHKNNYFSFFVVLFLRRLVVSGE